MTQRKSSPLIVCLTGSESSGKTTLARALAHLYRVPLVEEAARIYLAGRTDYGRDDLRVIAREQLRLEEVALAGRPRLVICDTDLLVIRIWWEVKYGALPDWLDARLRRLAPRLYLLTAPDFPWEPDPLRETGGYRTELHRRYRQALQAGGQPFIELTGDPNVRLAMARRRIDGMMSSWSTSSMPNR